jgi:hypothetical protein
MTNKGFEFMANVDVVRQKDLTVSMSWNHSINNNNIEDLGLVNEYFLGTFVIRKGLPYGSHYTYNYLGADPATGNATFETADGKTTLMPPKPDSLQNSEPTCLNTRVVQHWISGIKPSLFRHYSLTSLMW